MRNEHRTLRQGRISSKPLRALTLIMALVATPCAEPATTEPASSRPVPTRPAAPATLPGHGLEEHDFFYAGESKRGRPMFMVRKGKVVWSYDDPKGRGEVSDATLLSNGNVLLAHQFAVKLIAPDTTVLWHYEVPKGSEVHTAQMIGTKHVLFVQNGTPALLKVIHIVSGETTKEFPLTTRDPSPHGQFRHARLTAAGTVLVAHMDADKICEYNADGTIILTIPAARPWGAMELKNAHILFTDSRGIHEVTRQGETTWEFLSTDAPGYTLNNIQLAWRLPNGNTLFSVWFNNKMGKVLDASTLPVQGLEITPDKKVVWALRSLDNPDLGPATTIQILDEPDVPENVHFGDIS